MRGQEQRDDQNEGAGTKRGAQGAQDADLTIIDRVVNNVVKKRLCFSDFRLRCCLGLSIAC